MENRKPRIGRRIILVVILVLLIVLAVLVIALAVLGRVAPEWLDSFLYSAEELEILHK